MISNFGSVALVFFILAIVFVAKTVNVVPQQHAWVVERLGKYHATLAPGLNIVIPFIDRIAYKHILKEIPLDVPPQVCITRDNTQLQVDGILYFQVTDPMRASYGSSNYIAAITQLAQTTLRSVIGKMELDKTFEERDHINTTIVNAIDESAANWGVKVLRYEIKDLTPPKEILHSMQAQITAEREKRALIAASEGRKQEQINIAAGEREAAIAMLTGRAIAGTWRPDWHVAIYMLMLACAVRFIHMALFDGTLLSLHYYVVDALVCLGFGYAGFRVTRVRQMVHQYSWLNVGAGTMRWRRRTP